MTRIAIDARKLADFGIGSYLRGLIGGFAALDHETGFVLLAPREARYLLPALPTNFEWVDESAPGYSLREQLALSRTLKRLAPDLFHSPHYVLPAKTPARVVVTIHDLIHLVHPEFLPGRLALPYARFMLKRAARRAARILTVSAATAADLQSRLGVAADKIELIWNGVDERFREPVDEAAIERELDATGLEPGYFLFVGNPKPHKNLERLLAAFAELHSPAARLVIVGESATIRKESRSSRVISIGRVADERLPALFRGALALVFPSLYEGFGLPVAEAMAAGVPVIASSTPAVAEIAGNAAEIVNPLDVSGWTAAMRRVAGDAELRRRLSAAGRERAASFSWERAARRTLAVYRSVLAEPGK